MPTHRNTGEFIWYYLADLSRQYDGTEVGRLADHALKTQDLSAVLPLLDLLHDQGGEEQRRQGMARLFSEAALSSFPHDADRSGVQSAIARGRASGGDRGVWPEVMSEFLQHPHEAPPAKVSMRRRKYMARPQNVPDYPLRARQPEALELMNEFSRHVPPHQIFDRRDLGMWVDVWHDLLAAGRTQEANRLASLLDRVAHGAVEYEARRAGQPAPSRQLRGGHWQHGGHHFRGLATQEEYARSRGIHDPEGHVPALAGAAYQDNAEDPVSFDALADRYEELGHARHAQRTRNLRPPREDPSDIPTMPPARMKRKRRPRKMSGINAPAGGVLVRGQFYAGGKYIPSAEIEKAGHSEWRQVQEARARKYSRADGSLDAEAMMAGEKGKALPPDPHAQRLREARRRLAGGEAIPGLGARPARPRKGTA